MQDKVDAKRLSLRLPGYDYSAVGSYFITICSDQKFFRFGVIFCDQMMLNETGGIAKDEWFKLQDRYPNIQMGPFCVMPNHIHGIIQITPASTFSFSFSSLDGFISVGAGLAPANKPITSHGEIFGMPSRAGASPAPTNDQSNLQIEGKGEKVTVGNIVGAYKSLVMKACLANHKAKFAAGSEVPLLGKIWQRNYYEHVIRTNESYDKIAAYIFTNPQNWVKDKFYSKFE